MTRSCVLVLLLLLPAACRPPKYVKFVSPYKDFTCEVPWGWAVYLDSAGSDYASVTFAGPLEPEFLRGTPSLSIRWYGYSAPHRLPDGTVELYASTEDFTQQMMRQVYGPEAYTKAGSDFDQQLALSKNELLPDAKTVRVSAAEATHYVVYRTAPAPKGSNLGVVMDDQGNTVVRQRHAYVLLPMRTGFYAFVYPATRDGFEKFKAAFFNMVNTFKLAKEGPAGPVYVPQPQSAQAQPH